MKIAIISDIHGNLFALEKVLEDIEHEKCDNVICLGDLAMAGPEPNKTVELIKQMNWDIIQGNTDKMIAEYTDEMYESLKSVIPIMANALRNDAAVISSENKEFLRNLPENLEITINNTPILLVHGSPRRNNEDILPDLPLEQVEEMVADTNARLILCGHTHLPCGYQTNSGKTVVNVGSVGRPFTEKPDACYAIVTFDDIGFGVEHRFVEYDNEAASKVLASRNFDGAEKLSKMLINPELRHM
ncbi:metallophosphoesterase family protein [bacterium]|nr:metallophosphoesterase family protein [bacterium]